VKRLFVHGYGVVSFFFLGLGLGLCFYNWGFSYLNDQCYNASSLFLSLYLYDAFLSLSLFNCVSLFFISACIVHLKENKLFAPDSLNPHPRKLQRLKMSEISPCILFNARNKEEEKNF